MCADAEPAHPYTLIHTETPTMTLLMIAGALFILLASRGVARMHHARNSRQVIEARLADFVGH